MRHSMKALRRPARAVLSACVLLSAATVHAGPVITYGFETEDDLVTPLSHGQIVDPAFDAPGFSEFGTIFNVSSDVIGSDGHIGVTVFDSDLSGTLDPDLEVGTGNILILQNDDTPSRTGDFYDGPNDEANLNDAGSIIFDFLFPLEPLGITVVDANGGYFGTVTLTDENGLTRVYDIPSQWTTDVTVNLVGYQELDLTTLANQPSEPLAAGGDATATEDAGYDPTRVVQLKFSLIGVQGGTSSGGIDSLRLRIPEPASALLVGLAACGLAARRRR
ncbi:MAG: PEP-CTERM sorting domain-containing protein [Planctomycetota bacterium]